MKKLYSAVVVMFVAIMAFSGFECASTELTSAKLYIQQKNFDKALDALNKEIAKNPKSDEGYFMLGTLNGEKEDAAKMVDAYSKSLEISSKFADQIKNNRKKYWVDAFNRGVNLYNKAVKAPNADTAKIIMDKALNTFLNAAIIEPDSVDNYRNIGMIYSAQRNYDALLANYEKLYSHSKADYAYTSLGTAYMLVGEAKMKSFKDTKVKADSVAALANYTKALDILEEGYSKHPKNQDLIRILAAAYSSANKTDKGNKTFAKIVVDEPGNKNYRYFYGVFLMGVDKYEEAVAQFAEAVKLDENFNDAQFNLGVAYIKWGAQLRKASEEKGEMKSPVADEKFKLAKSTIEALVQKKTDDGNLWELLGKVYSIMGMTDEAQKAFKKADSLRN